MIYPPWWFEVTESEELLPVIPLPEWNPDARLYPCSLIRVVDGDTLWIKTDLGMSVTLEMDVRLYGIDAPELRGVSDPGPGKYALACALDWLEGKSLIVQTHKDSKEKYGRYLGRIYDAQTGQCLNDYLLAKNVVKPYAP